MLLGNGLLPHFGASGAMTATFAVTTTGAAQTLTINSLGVSAETVIDWGDGLTNAYTGTTLRTHVYASAGTYTVTINNPQNVTTFDIRDNKVTLNSADIKRMVNVATFIATGLKAGTFNSVDASAWRPTDFRLYSMPAGYAGTFNSVDASAWRPTTFYLYSMPAGYAGTFNSVDASAWRPTDFLLFSMPAGYAGTFNSVDASAWRPTTFYLYSMPAGYAGTFNSVDASAWRPTTFLLHSMPAGYAGTFNSVDASAWRPTTFRLYSMPAGYAGTFNSVDASAWRPTTFYLHSMPAGYAGTIAANDFAAWTTINNFQMQGNALSQAQVDAILWGLYQASIVPRTVTGGTINVGGSNAAPSGTFQAPASCPVTSSTPGKEVRHALLNDGCAAGFNTWATVTTS